MDTTAGCVAGALTFVWLGMVLAISFLEAPLKFRAPGVSLRVGLGIGRLVFRALNLAETGFAVAVAVAVAVGRPPTVVAVFTVVVVAVLAVQLGAVRPGLNRRSDQVLAGAEPTRSPGHLAYVGCEVVKVAALIGLGVSVLPG